MSDRELRIEKRWMIAARMDPEKFGFFYEKYQARIYRYALLRTSDEDAAADITADVFLKAQENLWKFRWQGITFDGWLYRIALNLIRHHHRDRVRKGTVNLDDIPEPSADLVHPLRELIRKEGMRAVHGAVLELDDRTATIFLLHYWQEHTTTEIGVILGIPVGTVRTRLNRGRVMLERILRRRLDGGPDGEEVS